MQLIITRNNEQYDIQRQKKRKTDHHVIGMGEQHATEKS